MKFVSIVCDSCRRRFVTEDIYRKGYVMDNSPDLCDDCCIIRGEDSKKSKEVFVYSDLYDTKN